MDIHLSLATTRGKESPAPGLLGAFGVTKPDGGSEEVSVMINDITDINTLHEASLAASSAIVRVVDRSSFLPAYAEEEAVDDDTAPDTEDDVL